MKPKYMLNLIHRHLQSIAGQVADDLAFLPDSHDLEATTRYDGMTQRIVERKLAEAAKLLREAEMLLRPCVAQEPMVGVTFVFSQQEAEVS